FWTHNDSGDAARLFAIDTAESVVVTQFQLPGIDAVDWEDMASGVIDGRPTLVVADTGDNARRRDHVTLLVIDEPARDQPARDEPVRDEPVRDEPVRDELAASGGRRPHPLDVRRRIHVQYPDGPRDCEAIA